MLDNSVVMTWFFEDERNSYCDSVLHAMEKAVAAVPAVWPLEAVNVVLVSERRGRTSRGQGEAFVQFLCELPIQVNPAFSLEVLSELSTLARRHQLSAYDASYLLLALKERLPIATMDQALKRAARREGVAAYQP